MSNAKTSGNSMASTGGFSEQERVAMKVRDAELRKEASRGEKAAAAEREVVTKIAEMEASDRAVAERLHALITTAAPELSPKLWYGQPAYARKGKVVCFFRSGQVDKERYSTFGFTPEANLDDESGVWPTSFAVTELNDKTQTMITELVKKAAS